MSSNKKFFLSPQAAAIYKHKLLKSYIPVWVGKVGSTSQGKRVIVYDAYSGPGRYEDDQPGSPEILVDTAIEMAKLRSVRTVFSEKDSSYCDRLTQMLIHKQVDPATYEVRPGPVERHMDDVLADAGDLPLFVFLDPYGLTVPFDRVVQILASRDKRGWPATLQPKTELLLNFSYEAVRRIGGVARSDKAYGVKDGQLEALGKALGGDWWRQLALDEPDGWVREVLLGYAHRVAKAARCGFITVEVADSIEAQPVYELILFTRHQDGLWEMSEAMSFARQHWRKWLVDKRELAMGGQTELRGLDFDDNEEAWVSEIAQNIERLLQSVDNLTIQNRLGEVLGRTLGLAREKHIRAAIKSLYGRQVVVEAPVGRLQRAVVRRREALASRPR